MSAYIRFDISNCRIPACNRQAAKELLRRFGESPTLIAALRFLQFDAELDNGNELGDVLITGYYGDAVYSILPLLAPLVADGATWACRNASDHWQWEMSGGVVYRRNGAVVYGAPIIDVDMNAPANKGASQQ